ncbi:MAG TPA: 2-isopropylmalate synthase, partial [Candidatus Aminicenantes bacterium]|nr:2-isopropylmalate synthase [Candidatus Aminicenantes bacterium]
MVKILDSTLREGEQTPGVYFDIHVKLAIAGILDELGVDFIEAGHPAVTEDIAKAVTLISAGGLKSKIAAHSRSMRSDIDKALECRADFIGIFYCVSDRRLQDYSTNLVSAVDKITSVIRYAKEKRPSLIIRYTPEDTVRSKYENVLSAAKAAVSAGADIISVADTTG